MVTSAGRATTAHSSRSPRRRATPRTTTGTPGSRSGSLSPRKSGRRNHGGELADFLAISGDGMFLSRNRSQSPTRQRSSRSSSMMLPRRLTTAQKERQDQIDRENRILLRKILEQHHGIRRQSSIPPKLMRHQSQQQQQHQVMQRRSHKNHQTSRKINQERIQHKTDYENLILLQKIQNVRPSKEIEDSFVKLSVRD